MDCRDSVVIIPLARVRCNRTIRTLVLRTTSAPIVMGRPPPSLCHSGSRSHREAPVSAITGVLGLSHCTRTAKRRHWADRWAVFSPTRLTPNTACARRGMGGGRNAGRQVGHFGSAHRPRLSSSSISCSTDATRHASGIISIRGVANCVLKRRMTAHPKSCLQEFRQALPSDSQR